MLLGWQQPPATIGLALSSVETNVYNVDLCLARRAEEVSQEIPENIALKVLQIRSSGRACMHAFHSIFDKFVLSFR